MYRVPSVRQELVVAEDGMVGKNCGFSLLSWSLQSREDRPFINKRPQLYIYSCDKYVVKNIGCYKLTWLKKVESLLPKDANK